MRKLINKIKTNSLEPREPKDPETCTLFSIYKAFAKPAEVAEIRQRYADGIAWGEMKQELFEYINEHITPARERYEALLNAPQHIEEQLQEGAKKARTISIPFMQELRAAVGISRIGS